MSNVVSFQEKKDRKIERKRRLFERVMFEHMMGCYTVIDSKGAILPVNLVDISHEGCLFQVQETDQSHHAFKTGQEVNLRFYFTKNNYIPVSVTVRYGNDFLDTQGCRFVRYGSEFDKSTQSFEALKIFIDFIYKFAQHSCLDKGDQKIYFL